ncbi:MAG: NAD-dependent epimerase/dehydratase family protein [Myxococcaceae bacterium]|nr:NAD-dependent epimerase/dehydratase family protein [Myxococcaceae bacterium]
MKILVTGATGFLGSHLVPRLIARGHHVRTLARSQPGPALSGAEHIQGSLDDRDAVRRALEGVDAVYHLAGLVSFRPKDSRRMYQLHVDCTRALLSDVRAAGVGRFILASTSGAIAVSKEPRIATEEDDHPIAVVGRWPYYASKIFEEQLTTEFCRRNNLPLVILNPSLLLGPGDDRLSSTWTISKFLNRDIPAMPNGGLSFVDVRDTADAFVAALEHGELFGRHLMGVNMSLKEFYERLSRMTGVPPPPLRLPKALNILGGKLLEKWADARGEKPALDAQEIEIGEHFFYFDSAKAERELGFRARDPQETLYDTVQYILQRIPPDSRPGLPGKLWATRKGT